MSDQVLFAIPGTDKFALGFVVVDPATGLPGSAGSGGASVPPVTAVIDSATPPKRWVMVTNYSASPAAVTFYEFGTVTAGAPTLPVTPDDDANAATEATLAALLALTGLNNDHNWSATTQTTVTSTDFLATANGTGYTAGQTLRRTRTLTHSTQVAVDAWANITASTSIVTPTAGTFTQSTPEVVTSITSRRTTSLSATPQTRTVTYLLTAPTVAHTDTGWV